MSEPAEEAKKLLEEAAADYAKAQERLEQYNYEKGFVGNNHGFTENGDKS
jgi:hypothetical protein